MPTLRSEVVSRGYNYFDWNVDANDAGTCAKKGVTDRKKCVYDNVTKHLSKKRRNIVLMHDIKSYTADALEDIIKYAKANNYSFEVLTYETKPVRFS
jgi:peptidoglycan/xylan/chitin deacetylase (PgdA/CDA1 family)